MIVQTERHRSLATGGGTGINIGHSNYFASSTPVTYQPSVVRLNQMAGNDQQHEWLAPWKAVDDGDTGLVAELVREVCSEHCLFGVNAIALATNSAPDRYDDVLFGVDLPDHRYAMVHLTWKPETLSDFPSTTLYRDWEHFVVDGMMPDNEAYLRDW